MPLAKQKSSIDARLQLLDRWLSTRVRLGFSVMPFQTTESMAIIAIDVRQTNYAFVARARGML
jgi:hypothetical protein